MCGSEKASGEAALFGGQSWEAKTSFKEGPVLLRFAGKPVGHPALFLSQAPYQWPDAVVLLHVPLVPQLGQFHGLSAQIEPFCLTLKQTRTYYACVCVLARARLCVFFMSLLVVPVRWPRYM